MRRQERNDKNKKTRKERQEKKDMIGKTRIERQERTNKKRNHTKQKTRMEI